jgi:hypothetical protein
MAQEAILERRIRPLLAVFMLGLVLGGLTAEPLDVKRLEVVKAVGQAEKGGSSGHRSIRRLPRPRRST